MIYELLGTTKQNVRVLHKGASLAALRDIGGKLAHYEIFRVYNFKGDVFHNSTDETFLVEHRNCPYWLNRGVASK